MRALLFSLLILCFSQGKASNPWRTYLLSSVYKTQVKKPAMTWTASAPACRIPQYVIPKGNIFCRLEDKLTRSSHIWIKVGVH
jgi:hypothetical protein